MERPHKSLSRWNVDAAELIGEIALAAERIGEARTLGGDRVYPTDALSRLLRAIERSHYCLSIADAARALGVSRQAAHKLAYRAAAGCVELLTNPQDQRILQLLLTPSGQSRLRAARLSESAWLAVVLNGLGGREMAATTHVVRVIRQRLERDARLLARSKRVPLES